MFLVFNVSLGAMNKCQHLKKHNFFVCGWVGKSAFCVLNVDLNLLTKFFKNSKNQHLNFHKKFCFLWWVGG